MSTRIVKTQAAFDAAIADGMEEVIIDSPREVWFTVRAHGSATVRAHGSATVRAYGSATVRAHSSATVLAYDSATVRAHSSATVLAYDSATVEAYGSATVRAYGSATVRAYDSATVRAYDSATVEAYGSATVRAYDSATVEAYDSATVRAYGSATVRAYDSATVEASSHVAVHRHSGHATIAGGVLIDHAALDLSQPADWCAYHGVTVDGQGIATLYKAVNDQWATVGDSWSTDRGADYSPGTLPACDDWTDNNDCGGGLHFSPHPWQSRDYYPSATRYVAVGVALADLRPILGGTPKCKAPRVVVACREVTIDGEAVS